MQQFRIHVPLRQRLVRRISLRRPLLAASAALLLVSSLTTILQHAPDAHATLPLYGQESAGFGDRKVFDGWYDDFALDASGNIFINGGGGNGFIRKFAADGTFIKDISNPSFVINNQTPLYRRMAVAPNSDLFAVDENHHVIHVFTNDGTYLRAISSVPTNAEIAFDSTGNFYATDAANHRVRKYANNGTLLYDIGGPTAGTADGKFNNPGNIAVDSQNNLIVADVNNGRIQMFTSTGMFIRKFGQRNTGLMCPAQPSLDNMAGLTIDASDNIYVATHASWCNNYVQKFSSTGTFIATQSRSTPTSYLRTGPGGVIYELEYHTYISGVLGGYELARYDTNGTVLTSSLLGGPDKVVRPAAVAQDSAGNTYVADATAYHVLKYDTNHTLVQTLGAYGNGDGQFRAISSLTIDRNDVLYVGDRYSNTIQKLSTTGTFLGRFGSNGSADGQFSNIEKLAVRADGTIAALDNRYNNSTIQFFNPDGTFVSKISLANIVSYAFKSDGSLTIATRYTSYGSSNYAFVQYNTANVQVGSKIGSWYDSTLGGLVYTGEDLAYDTYDNLYALTTDSKNTQYYQKLARINLDNPDLPPYELVGPQISSLFGRLLFSATNQLLILSESENYIYQYNVTGTLEAPNAPVNLATNPGSHGAVTVSWQAASGPIATKYLVEYRPHGQMQWLRHDAVTSTSTTITGLLEDDYDIRVRAMNSAGMSITTQTGVIHVAADYRYGPVLTAPNSGAIRGISFGPDGRRYDVDGWNDVINIYSAAGTFVKSFASSGSGPGQLSSARQPAIANNKLYVPDSYNQRVNIYDLEGNFLSSFGGTYGTGDGEMYYPSQVFADPDGTVYVVNEYSNIQHYTADGTFIARAFTSLPEPVSMTRDQAGNHYVAVYPEDNGAVFYKYDSTGTELLRFGTYGNGSGQTLETPGITINSLGQLVANDGYNERIGFYDSTTGAFLTSIGRGYSDQGEYLMFDDPYTIAQAANGDLYIPNSYSSFTQILQPTFSTGGTTPPAATAPSSPRSVTAASPSAGSLTTTWQVPSSDGGQPLADYLLEYRPAGTASWSQLVLAASTTSHTLTGVPTGDYEVRVSARNSIGTSPPSAPVTVTVAAPSVNPAPTPTPAPTPSPNPTSSPVVSTPTSPYIAPPTLPATPVGKITEPDDKPVAQPSAPSASPIEITTHPDRPSAPTIAWQPPASGTPDYYVIEYRDTTIPDGDTTTPWRQVSRVPGSKTSADITLPEGSYTIRVAAIMPGESATRVIVGVAHITIPAKHTTPVTPATPATPLWIGICIALLTVATFVLIPFLFWKRRRKAAAARARQTTIPPRWQ